VALQLALIDSTLRSSSRGEYVATPPWFVRALLSTASIKPWRDPILDAGAGLGEIGSEIHRWAKEKRKRGAVRITGLELFRDRAEQLPRPQYEEIVEADLFSWETPRRWPIIITNPPFSLWKEWTVALLGRLLPGGSLFCVLPWEYCSRAEAWWTAHPAWRIYRTARRPWKIETREVCWVEFRCGHRGATSLRWLVR
jgi:hypothetical protein